ncbi:LuxR C-terminal-related transcriptional regulator [Streptomyces sp. NPDC127036]|uniref:helix-turn-helix transcriptional regulator n=1 Tax=Streptomyces sp. NPDC127036 TaxID=3347112 RepID=UPI00366489CF
MNSNMQISDNGFDDLDPKDLAVHDAAVREGGLSLAQPPSIPGMSYDAFACAVEKLRAVRLLRESSPGILVPVSPRTAAAELIGPLAREVLQRQEVIARISDSSAALIARYTGGNPSAAGSVQQLKDLHSIRLALEEAATRCHSEVLTAQPGGVRSPEVLAEALPRDRQMLERGVKMRTLYQHTTRYSKPAQAYVQRVSALGAKVRTLDEFFNRLIIFDRETVFIPDQTDPMSAVVIREPSITAFLCDVFERSWHSAEDFEVDTESPAANRTISDDVKQTILRLLADGIKDEVIARRLGMSVRTCRRHIAEIMLRLGATSRFQGGYLAHRLGMVESQGDSFASRIEGE